MRNDGYVFGFEYAKQVGLLEYSEDDLAEFEHEILKCVPKAERDEFFMDAYEGFADGVESNLVENYKRVLWEHLITVNQY